MRFRSSLGVFHLLLVLLHLNFKTHANSWSSSSVLFQYVTCVCQFVQICASSYGLFAFTSIIYNINSPRFFGSSFMQITLQAHHINNAQYAWISGHSVSISFYLPLAYTLTLSPTVDIQCSILYTLNESQTLFDFSFSCVLSAHTHTYTNSFNHYI